MKKDNKLKLNIMMKDGTELKEICVFLNKSLGNSIINTKEEFENAFNNNKFIYFSGSYVQGGFISQQVKKFEYLDCKLTIDDLKPFERESEILAEEIAKEIYLCKLIKGTWAQQVKRILEIIDKYK